MDSSGEAEKEKELGNIAYKKREFTEAIAHYDKALEINPDHLAYLTNRAAAKLEMNDYDGAIADCEEVITQNKERALRTDFKIIARAYARIGTAYVKKKELTKAIEAFENSLLETHDNKVYDKLRETKKMLKDEEEKAYRSEEKSKEERQAGNEFFKAGKFPQAIERYTEAIKRNPTDPAPYSNRAAAYMKLGEFPFALKDCDKCLELDPKYFKAYSRKGGIHFYMKEYHKAIDAYKKALEIEPTSTEVKQELNRVMMAIQETSNSGEIDEQQRQMAMADPEIQRILMDPAVNQVLKEMSENPQAAQKALDDPVIAEKINKLIASGIVRVTSA